MGAADPTLHDSPPQVNIFAGPGAGHVATVGKTLTTMIVMRRGASPPIIMEEYRTRRASTEAGCGYTIQRFQTGSISPHINTMIVTDPVTTVTMAVAATVEVVEVVTMVATVSVEAEEHQC